MNIILFSHQTIIILLGIITVMLALCLIFINRKQKYYSSRDILRESEEKFRRLFEDSPIGMLMTDRNLRIIKVNQACSNIIGYGKDELMNLTFRDFTRNDYIPQDESSIKRLFAGEISVYKTRKPYIRKNGAEVWGSTTISTIRNQKNDILYFLAMIEDISIAREAESELEKSLSLLRATLESTADGILVVNMDSRIVQYNQKFAEMWRIPQEVLDNGEDEDLLRFVKDQLIDPDSFIENVHKLYSQTEAVTSDVLEFIDGRAFERYSQPQIINGKSVGRVWSFRDITEKRKTISELISAKEKAEEGDRLKTAFLHNVSHEIRTPMNAIIGFSTLMNENGISESERLQYANIIAQSSTQLLSIINDIVDIANIESGQVRVNPSECNLNRSLRDLTEQFRYPRNNVSLNLNLGLPDSEAMIITDITKLIQIISNLINNSLKFTREGSVNFGYTVKNNDLEFYVSDTGIGISPEHLHRIFDRFYQADVAGTREYGGTGLGLSICKAYVTLLGGTIRVESEPGKGSLFLFTIPYTKQ